MMARPPKEAFLGLDIPFNEALERYVRASPKQLEAVVKQSKKKTPPGGRKKKRKPPSKKVKATNVISLKQRKISMRRRGML